MARVDVIVPCYNYGDLLEACVASVLSQQEVDTRVLIMDDASTDSTPEVCRRLAARDPRVEYRRHDVNRGHIATYNEALNNVTGDYCMILSADDLLTPGALMRATCLMDAHPEVGLTYGRDITFRHVPPTRPATGRKDCSHRSLTYLEFLDISCRLGHTPIQAPTAIVRTVLHREIGGYRPELPHSGDTEIWLRMAVHAAVAEINADQAFRRLHTANMSLGYSPLRRLEEQQRAFDTHFRDYAPPWPQVAKLKRVVNRTIAESAFWSGTTAFENGDRRMCDAFLAFAAGICPDIESWGAWRRFRWKRRVGVSAWRWVEPFITRRRKLTHQHGRIVPHQPGAALKSSGPAAESPRADLRILIELNSADLHIGAVNDALDLAELAAPGGVRFVLCGPLTREFCDEAARRGIEMWRVQSRPFSRRGLPLYVIDVLAWMVRLTRWHPDVVHLNYTGYGPSLACAARLCGIPIVARAGPVIPNNLSNRWVAAYVANSRAHAADLLDSPLAPRVVVTGDLFRPDRVRSTIVPERALPPRRPGVARLVFLGQLVERKGLHVLIEAFARLQGAAELLLVGGDWGTPGYPQRLKAMAREAGVASRIHCENHRQDVGAVLSTADVFVLPSFSDARPRSIIEAMSLGIPVVASNVGGIPSLVAHEETGLLVPTGDPGALAAAVDRLIHSPDLCHRLGAAGRQRVEDECRPERTAYEYVRLYRRLVGARPEREVIETLLCGEDAATSGAGPRCNVLRQRDPLRFDCAPLHTALEGMSTGDYIAYAIALNAPPVARLVTLATLPLRLRRVERTMARGGTQVVGRYGVDPSLDAPSCVYELNSPASEYADRCLRPRGSAQALRRLLARWLACDPALGGVVVVGRKP